MKLVSFTLALFVTSFAQAQSATPLDTPVTCQVGPVAVFPSGPQVVKKDLQPKIITRAGQTFSIIKEEFNMGTDKNIRAEVEVSINELSTSSKWEKDLDVMLIRVSYFATVEGKTVYLGGDSRDTDTIWSPERLANLRDRSKNFGIATMTKYPGEMFSFMAHCSRKK